MKKTSEWDRYEITQKSYAHMCIEYTSWAVYNASMKLFSTSEAAKELGISSVTVRQHCQRGSLSCIKVDEKSEKSSWVILEKDLNKFKKKRAKRLDN